MTSKRNHFVEEPKIVSKLANILNKREDSNFEEDDEFVETTRKLCQAMQQKVNTKSSKAKISKKQ